MSQKKSSEKGKIRSRIIKRYQNRKLYDTKTSHYVTLDDIAKMVRSNENFVILDSKTYKDITASTFIQIIFEGEKKGGKHAPLFILKEMIQYEKGGLSKFLEKIGAFSKSHLEKEELVLSENFISQKKRVSRQNLRKPFVEKTVTQTQRYKRAHTPSSLSEEEKENKSTPHLPAPTQFSYS